MLLLQAWRPGMTRADLEEEHRKASGEDAVSHAGKLQVDLCTCCSIVCKKGLIL